MPNINRAPFAYFGGKYRILSNLQSYIPTLKQVDCYVEPFVGSGTLFFSRERLGEVEVINDYSSFIYNFYYVLREQKSKLLERLKYTPYSVETFLEARNLLTGGKYAVTESHIDIPKNKQVYYAWALYLVFSMSIYRNGRNFSRDSLDHSKAREFKKNVDRLEYCAARLRNATIENEDVVKVCKRYDGPRTFIYLDPPYLEVKNPKSMRLAYHGNDGSKRDDEEEGLHERLLKFVLSSRSMIMISNYSNPLYNKALKDWNREEIKVKTVTTRGKRGAGLVQDATEIIWTSPNVPTHYQLQF